MEIALKEAYQGIRNNHGGPFGAVIVKDSSIISKAHNEVLRTNDPTAHAEILAIRKASKALGKFDLSDCEIYTSSQPCPMCLAAIYWARIKTVYYSTDRDDVAKIGFDDSLFYEYIKEEARNQEMKMINIDRSQGLILFREWSEKSDRKLY